MFCNRLKFEKASSIEKFKVNESRYIALFVVSRSTKQLSSIDCVNIYLFLILFSTDFTWLEGVGLPYIH